MNLLIVALAMYGLIVSDNLIRKIMCLTILESMIILAFLGTGYAEGRAAPILGAAAEPMVDPVPQALMLTAIVIGVCFNSLALAFIVKLYQKTRTLKASELHEF
jgi:multicomponent Na+:H+ antiporter subunit C